MKLGAITGTARIPHADGTFPFLIIAIGDRGAEKSQFGLRDSVEVFLLSNETRKTEDPDTGGEVDTGERHVLSCQITKGWGDKSNMQPFCVAALKARKAEDVDRGMEIEVLLGKTLTAPVVHKESKGRVFANINLKGVSKARESVSLDGFELSGFHYEKLANMKNFWLMEGLEVAEGEEGEEGL